MITYAGVTVTRQRPSGERFTVLDRVWFTVHSDHRIAILGQSGAGKTTMLRLINWLDDPDGGSIYLDGSNLRDISPPVLRRRVGMLFQ